MATGDITIGGVNFSPADFDAIAAEVTTRITATSKDPGQYEEISSLQGISSIPVFQQTGTTYKLVRVLISILKGVDGKEIHLQKTDTHIQWRWTDGMWNNLVALQDIKGERGDVPTFRTCSTGIEWKYTTEADNAWKELVGYDTLKLNFSDLTPVQIQAFYDSMSPETLALFQQPATEAAASINTQMNQISSDWNENLKPAIQTATSKAEVLNTHQPIIQNGTWWVWNTEIAQYTDSSLPARGPAGKGPIILPNGNYGNWDESSQTYSDCNVPAIASVDLQGMMKISVYDTDGDGTVDKSKTAEKSSDSDKLENIPASGFERRYVLPSNADAKINYWLLGYAYDGVNINKTWLDGTLSFTRGASNAGLVFGKYLISTGSAYVTIVPSKVVSLISSGYSPTINVVTLRYNGVKYLALRSSVISGSTVIFNGEYIKNGDNTDFQRLVDGVDAVTDVTVVSTNDLDATASKLGQAVTITDFTTFDPRTITTKVGEKFPFTHSGAAGKPTWATGTGVGSGDITCVYYATTDYRYEYKLYAVGSSATDAYKNATEVVAYYTKNGFSDWVFVAKGDNTGKALTAALADSATVSNRTQCETNSATVAPSAWTQDAVSGLWKATVTDAKIDSNCKIDVSADIDTQPIADAAGIFSKVSIDTTANTFALSAKNNPTGNINFQYSIGYMSGGESIGFYTGGVPDELTAEQKALLNFQLKANTVTSLANLPKDGQTIYANINANQTLSVLTPATPPLTGQPIHLFIRNAGATARTITIPTTGNYRSMDGASVTLPASGLLEIDIVYDANQSLYKIMVREAA